MTNPTPGCRWGGSWHARHCRAHKARQALDVASLQKPLPYWQQGLAVLAHKDAEHLE